MARKYGAPKLVSSAALRLPILAEEASPKLFIDEGRRQSLERRLRAAYEERKGKAVVLSITDNRNSILTQYIESNVLYVRLHHMFLDAEPEVLNALVQYILTEDPDDSLVVDAYIAKHAPKRKAKRGPETTAFPLKGNCHDIQKIYDDLNAKYFNGEVKASIVWARFGPRKNAGPRKKILLGSYYQDDKLIRIHPVLDNAWVPKYLIADVIHHEMLHQVFSWDEGSANRCLHSPEFREREKLYKWHARAELWLEKNMPRLLRWG